MTNALLGTQQRDLSRLVAGAGRTFGAFASREEDLKGFIDNFNVFLPTGDAKFGQTDYALDSNSMYALVQRNGSRNTRIQIN